MGISVLIADDSAFMRKTIVDILLEKKFIVILGEAKNGKEAIEMVQSKHPDVLILDLIMPEINGLDALQKIMDSTPTPTIILSAISPQNMDTSIQALLYGAFDYVIKPGGLGAKDLPLFREELLEKVTLAAQSPIKRILEKEKKDLLDKNTYIRQEIVSETFKFGKYINTLEPIKETDQTEKTAFNIQSTIEQKDNIEINIKLHDIKPVQSAEEIPESRTSLNRDLPLEQKIESESKEKVKSVTIIEEISLKKNPNEMLIKESEHGLSSVEKQILRNDNFDLNPLIKKKTDKETIKSNQSKITRDFRSIAKKKSRIGAKEHNIADHKSIEKEINRASPKSSAVLNNNIIVMGASVGGPRTIRSILKDIPSSFRCPILIVQHLGGNFVKTFVNTLNDSCDLPVKIALNEEYIEPGVIYVAPGGMHMEISVKKNRPCVKTFVGTPVHFVIPSVDLLFLSAARVYQNRTIGILLTGMGEDGVEGLGAIQKAGGCTIAESEETCILYGMPKFAAERGFANLVIPNYKIVDYILEFGK